MQPRLAGVGEEVLTVAMNALKRAAAERSGQLLLPHAQHAVVAYPDAGDRLPESVLREITREAFDLRQLGHVLLLQQLLADELHVRRAAALGEYVDVRCSRRLDEGADQLRARSGPPV